MENLTFGNAIEALKQGKKVARKDWKTGMFLLMGGGYSISLEKLLEGTQYSKEFVQSEGCSEFKILPHISMWVVDKLYITGWLASQSDMLSEDWVILP